MLPGVTGQVSGDDRTILVVDDDPDQRAALAELLSRGGYHVLVACDGQDALDLLSAGLCPSLVVLDLTMPRMDGWSLLAHLRECHSTVRVLVTSAVASERPLAGADAWLEKPFDAAVFSSLVARLFAGVRAGVHRQ